MVSYDFYRDTYHGGSISDVEWPMFCHRAQEQLDRYKRIYTVKAPQVDSEAMAVCAMADSIAYFSAVQNGMGAVQSASIGSVSVSYGNATSGVDLSPKGQARELYRCARQYLEICRGVG